MSWLKFENNPIGINLALFVIAAVAVWIAGTRLERQADVLAIRSGVGKAFLGMLLLAIATSLPEIATTLTAVWIGNVDLAVHNLLGSVAFNTAALAIADFVAGGWALTHRAPKYVLLMEGVGVAFLLTLVLMGTAVGRGVEESVRAPEWIRRAGLWELMLIFGYFGVLYLTHRGQKSPRWQPDGTHADPAEQQTSSSEVPEPDQRGYQQSVTGMIAAGFCIASLVVLAAGWTIAQAGDALATQTGLGGSFVGFTLVAIATTLPEISTTISAARAANYDMAVSNIFGSSAFMLMLLGVVGFLAPGKAIIQSAVPSASFAAGLGIAVTLIYLWGLLERQDRTVLRMGWDSAAVLVLVSAGSLMIYVLQ